MPHQVPTADSGAFADGMGAKLYGDYQTRLGEVDAVDFGDLLLLPLRVFMDNRDVLAEYHRRFRYVLVDEYQDTNMAQYLWLRLLSQGSGNICCVGDDDQSIYGWRGAEVGNILRFENDFPGAEVIRLERNYRSTSHILGAASGLIANNRSRLGKTLWTESADGTAGEPVRVQETWDGEEEARVVGDAIEALQRQGENLDACAVLVRAGHQTRAFEERFMTIGLPYRVIGGLRFYERREIRDACAYLRLIRQDGDDLAFERIVNTPKRGLGDKSLRELRAHARERGLSLLNASGELAAGGSLPPQRRRVLRAFFDAVQRWRASASSMPPARLAETVLDESGYAGMWNASQTIQAPARLENLKELVAEMENWESLADFLDHVSLVMDADSSTEGDMVSIMTLHGAKGLEFDNVFLPGWEEGVFPNWISLEEGTRNAVEEERRLAYVGLTRARKRAMVLHASGRMVHGRWQHNPPSRFVEELPAEHVEHATRPGSRYGLHGSGGVDDDDILWPDADRRARRAGFQRLAEARREGVRGIRAVPAPAVGDAPVPDPGSRVFHDKFGYGQVTTVDGDKLHIVFEVSGLKKIKARFVTPA